MLWRSGLRRVGSVVLGGVASLVLPATFGCGSYLQRLHAQDIQRRAESGDAQAMFELANGYSMIGGGGVAPESSGAKADHWYREAAKLGHTGAMFRLSQGGGAPNEERVMWLKKGAELGDGACMIELTNGYQHQMYGLPYDPVEAFKYRKRYQQVGAEKSKFTPDERQKELNLLIENERQMLPIALKEKGWSQQDIDRVMVEIK